MISFQCCFHLWTLFYFFSFKLLTWKRRNLSGILGIGPKLTSPLTSSSPRLLPQVLRGQHHAYPCISMTYAYPCVCHLVSSSAYFVVAQALPLHLNGKPQADLTPDLLPWAQLMTALPRALQSFSPVLFFLSTVLWLSLPLPCWTKF